MTRFKNILRRTNRPDEKLILMQKGISTEKDELGFAQEKYIPVQELHGIIQAGQTLDIDFHGQESQVSYVAYIMPEFNLERKNLNEYRIKYERPYESMLLKIMTYNPNLFLRHKRHHIRLGLILEKKEV